MGQCLLCSNSRSESIFRGPLRAGTQGKYTNEAYSVELCGECDLSWLNPFPPMTDAYESGDYRLAYNDQASVAAYQKLHDHLENEKLSLLDISAVRGRKVADFGCGGGSFLGILKSLASGTVAVEPNRSFHPALKEMGHQVFSYGADLAKAQPSSLDVAFSFQVIEHVPNPVEFLESMAQSLKAGGSALVVTPNRRVIQAEVGIPEFDQFNYRTAHYWYFSKKSFELAAKKAGFTEIEVGYSHRYDLSNFALWLRDRKPTGWSKTPVFDAEINAAWAAWLERSGMADNLVLRVKKSV